jgi:hypothetical protein
MSMSLKFFGQQLRQQGSLFDRLQRMVYFCSEEYGISSTEYGCPTQIGVFL